MYGLLFHQRAWDLCDCNATAPKLIASYLSADFDNINLIHYPLFCRMFCWCIFVFIPQCVKLIQREIFKFVVAIHVQICVL